MRKMHKSRGNPRSISQVDIAEEVDQMKSERLQEEWENYDPSSVDDPFEECADEDEYIEAQTEAFGENRYVFNGLGKKRNKL